MAIQTHGEEIRFLLENKLDIFAMTDLYLKMAVIVVPRVRVTADLIEVHLHALKVCEKALNN